MTGSYDCTVALWDERQMGREPVERLETGGLSVWDIRVHPQTNTWGIASIYDGYLFDVNASRASPSPEKFSLNDLGFRQRYTGHSSICYSFAWTNRSSDINKPAVLTSSFYDCKLHTV